MISSQQGEKEGRNQEGTGVRKERGVLKCHWEILVSPENKWMECVPHIYLLWGTRKWCLSAYVTIEIGDTRKYVTWAPHQTHLPHSFHMIELLSSSCLRRYFYLLNVIYYLHHYYIFAPRNLPFESCVILQGMLEDKLCRWHGSLGMVWGHCPTSPVCVTHILIAVLGPISWA